MSVKNILEEVKNHLDQFLDYLRGIFTLEHGKTILSQIQTGMKWLTSLIIKMKKVITLQGKSNTMGDSLMVRILLTH